MTSKSSICIKCAALSTYEDALCVPAGSKEALLISDCAYGGINAGNRKQCQKFVPALPGLVEMRIAVIESYEKQGKGTER